jgi:PHP family Zn ribbon phosphoesterase
MDMQTESIFNAKELRTLRITCSACKTAIVFDLANVKLNLPKKCPSCGIDFQKEVTDAIFGYRQLYVFAGDNAQVTFSFQV